MAAQEAENTAYGIIYFLYITAQGRSDEPRTKSCSAKASTIFESHLHCTKMESVLFYGSLAAVC